MCRLCTLVVRRQRLNKGDLFRNTSNLSERVVKTESKPIDAVPAFKARIDSGRI